MSTHWDVGIKEVFSFPVKCIKNTPAYFAERLYKAMKVSNLVLFGLLFCVYIYDLKRDQNIQLMSPSLCVRVCVCVFRELGPKTQPSSGSWSPALKLTCWIFARSMSKTTASRCTHTSL